MLTDEIIAAAESRDRPYKISDSHGLYVMVRPSGTKSIRLKYRLAGKEQTMVFGHHPLVSIAEARRLSREAKDIIRRRGKPGGFVRPIFVPAVPKLEDIPMPEGGPCNVYFVQAASGHIKVGVARDVARRIAEIGANHPEPLRLLGTMTGGYGHEHYVHRLFHEDRRHGEWFKPSQRLLDFIEDNAQRA